MRCSPSDVDIFAYRAIQAANTVGRIGIIGDSDLRWANVDTKIAVNALSFDFKSHETDPVEMGVDRSERAESAAKRSAGDDKEEKENNQDRNFENVQPPDHIRLDDGHRVHRAERIPENPWDSGAQCPPGTDSAEPVRFNEVRQKNREDEKRHVFAVLQRGMNSELLAFDLVGLVLNPTERAEPAADGATEDHSNRTEETHKREWDFADGAEVLENTYGAGRNGGWTGVTV